VPLAEDRHMIQAIAPERPNQTFNIWILPGRSRCGRPVPNTRRPNSTCERVPISPIIVTHQIGRHPGGPRGDHNGNFKHGSCQAANPRAVGD
jgi:hypothetical protein